MKLTALLPVLLMLLWGCAPPGPPPPRLDVSISDINAVRIGMMEQTYNLLLRVQNPNNFDIDTDGLSFDIEANGKHFARGVSNRAVSVPRLGEAMVNVDAISDLSAVIRQMRGAPGFGMGGLKYRLVGRFFSGERRFPFDHRGEIAPGERD